MEDDGNDPFANIVDDTDARKQCMDWIYGEIFGKRTPEEIEAELVASGWNPDDVAIMVEEVRKNTRESRGVFTREEAADAAERHSRNLLHGKRRLGR